VKNKMSNELTKSEIKQSMPKEQELSFLQRKILMILMGMREGEGLLR